MSIQESVLSLQKGDIGSSSSSSPCSSGFVVRQDHVDVVSTIMSESTKSRSSPMSVLITLVANLAFLVRNTYSIITRAKACIYKPKPFFT